MNWATPQSLRNRFFMRFQHGLLSLCGDQPLREPFERTRRRNPNRKQPASHTRLPGPQAQLHYSLAPTILYELHATTVLIEYPPLPLFVVHDLDMVLRARKLIFLQLRRA